MRAQGCAVAIGVVWMALNVVCYPVVAFIRWVGGLFGRDDSDD